MANGQPWLNNGAVEVLSRLAEHPLWKKRAEWKASGTNGRRRGTGLALGGWLGGLRSEEHTSELQSQSNLVCRLLLEKKKGTLEDNISRFNYSRTSIWRALCCSRNTLSPPQTSYASSYTPQHTLTSDQHPPCSTSTTSTP